MTDTEEQLYERAIGRVLQYVSRRPHSRHELATYLIKVVPDAHEVRERVLNKLQEWGYVDDTAFAEWWISARQGRNARGKRVIAQELRMKGVDRDCIQVALDTYSNRDTEIILVQKEIEKRSQRLLNLEKNVIVNKLFSTLVRRGFSSDIVRRAIDEWVKTAYNNR